MESLGGHFDWTEYSVFGGMLVISAGIGIYFGCRGGQDTISGYLFGSKELTVFPVALSLITGHVSGITLIGYPTEIYSYGTLFLWQLLSHVVAGLVTMYVVLPLFYELQLVSLFEYMELRFGKAMRKIVSAISVFGVIVYLPVVIYGPAIALTQVSGMNVHIMSSLLCIVCIFYTTLGGLKAVVWTDTIQGVFMIFSVMTVLVLGLVYEGGPAHVLQKAYDGGRIEVFNFDLDPTKRTSFCSVFPSQACFWLMVYSYNPTSVQRYLSLPTLKQARRAAMLMVVGLMVFVSVCGAIGLILFAAYETCDPLSSKMITRPDQILPLYITRFSGTIPGLPGLFLAGVVSAALSTMSANFNCFSGILYEDFVENWFHTKPSERTSSVIMKIIVLVLGGVCLFLVAIVDKLGAVLEIAMAFAGVMSGPTLGLFIMGTCLPWVTNKGAIIGGAIGTSFMAWISFGYNVARASGEIHYETKPMRVDGCSFNVTLSPLNMSTVSESDVFVLFKISIFYYHCLGTVITVMSGLIGSFLTGANDPSTVKPELFVPLIRGKWGMKRKTKYNVVALKMDSESLGMKQIPVNSQ